MNYIYVLADFKTDHDAYRLVRKQDSPDTPFVNNKDEQKKIIKCLPIFEDAHTFGSKGPLVYVIRKSVIVPDIIDDTIDDDSHYGAAGSLLEELI